MITAAIGIFFLLIFVLGLAESNTAGFAGFKSGLPFWMIALTVMAMVLYDFMMRLPASLKASFSAYSVFDHLRKLRRWLAL
jgi:hypothetical protein